MTWGLLSPGQMSNTRRARTLGVGAAVRAFNDLAVPGLGGVWFGKQLVLATLGVMLAQDKPGKRISNIAMANAVEALACCMTLNHRANAALLDGRLRGSTKLRGKDDLRFSVVSRPGFYVTQPMRMASVQTLPALGLVEADATRFNAFEITPLGRELVEKAVGRPVLKALVEWVAGSSNMDSAAVRRALSPLTELPEPAQEIIASALQQGSPQEDAKHKDRRRTALAWVESLRLDKRLGTFQIDWATKPALIDEAHWVDLHAGALFQSARDAAIDVLLCVEKLLNTESRQLPLTHPRPAVAIAAINTLRTKAQAFSTFGHPQAEAKAFCLECVDTDDTRLLGRLVARDDRVLQLRQGAVVPGPAFEAVTSAPPAPEQSIDAASEPAPDPHQIPWPDGMSRRLNNLFLLNADLHQDITPWMNRLETVPGDDA